MEHSQRDNMRGALIMTAAMAGYTFNDATMKFLLQEMPLYQAIFLRGAAATLFLTLIAACIGTPKFRFARRDAKLVALRSLGEVGGTYFFINALVHMPLPTVVAILQALPLTVSLAGALFFREPLGWRRLLAIVVGFVGVMLIVRPGATMDFYALFALGAVICITLRDLASRQLSASVSSWPVSIITALVVTFFGLAGTTTEVWQPVSLPQAKLLAGATAFLIAGYVFSVSSMRVGSLAVVTPFRYTGILFALLIGALVFGDWPDALTFLGIIIVVASGLVTLYREQVLARKLRDPVAVADGKGLG